MQSQGRINAGNTTGQWSDNQASTTADMQASNAQQLASPPDQVTRIVKPDESGSLTGWIEALGVDSSYKPPPERTVKPVACFYVKRNNGDQPEYYRAIYLMQRTIKDFATNIALKWNIEPTKINCAIHVLASGLEVEMDDDVIRELTEGQDMMVEVEKLESQPAKREWDMSLDAAVDGDDVGAGRNVLHNESYNLKLRF